jgi:hypothetical protein
MNEPHNTCGIYKSAHTWGETTNLTSNGASKRRQDNFPGNKNLGQIATPIDFIASNESEKLITRVILTLEMAKAFSTLKAQSKKSF